MDNSADVWEPTVLGFALLQVLTRQSSSGYDLKKFFQASIGHSWHAYDTQIYRELKRLEAHGYATGVDVGSGAGPRRRLYEITARGTSVLVDWLVSPITLSKVKDEFGLRVWTASLFPAGTLRNMFINAREQWVEALADMTQSMDRVEHATNMDPDEARGRRLAIGFAAAVVRAKIAWVDSELSQFT